MTPSSPPSPSPSPLVVSQADAGQKLIQFLGRVLAEDVPRSALMRWIRTGQVRVDGCRAQPFDRLAAGAAVRVPPFAGLKAARAEEGGLDAAGDGALEGLAVLAKTAEFLVVNKPAGLPVHPGSGWTDSVQTRLARAYAGQGFSPTIAHRLDRDTSGVLLVARTFEALGRAHEAFRGGAAVKEYLAWVLGEWRLGARGQAVEMRDSLEKSGPAGREKMEVGQGKAARLEAQALRVRGGRTLVRVRLFTGRTHQIRAQLSSRGHPIAGDAKYGGGPGPMLLHAWRLRLGAETFSCLPQWGGRWAVGEDDLETAT